MEDVMLNLRFAAAILGTFVVTGSPVGAFETPRPVVPVVTVPHVTVTPAPNVLHVNPTPRVIPHPITPGVITPYVSTTGNNNKGWSIGSNKNL
jgi:hypothetical protein